MSDWTKVGEKLRTGNRKPMARHTTTTERCDGCGVEVTRGTLHNVVKSGAEPMGYDAGRPYYRLEDWQALCARCRR